MPKLNSDILFSIIILSIVTLMSILLIFGPYSVSSVSTNSMEPTHEGYLTKKGDFNFFKGDLLILDKKSPEIGDTVLFKAPKSGNLFLHRIVAERASGGKIFFATKGDNNIFTDVFVYDPEINIISEEQILDLGWIPKENILGVAIISVPLLGGLLNSILHPVGLFVLIIIFFIVVLLFLKRKAFFTNKSIKLINKKLEALKISFKISRRIILISKSYVISIVLISVLLISFFSINLIYQVTGSNDIDLVTRENEKFPNSIKLTNIHTFSSEKHNINGKEVYFYNAKIQLSSRSIFNSIKSITLTTNYKNENYTNYDEYISNYSKINFIYGFSGVKNLNTILIFIDPFSFNSSVEIEIIVSVIFFGLFADKSFEKIYEVILK